MITNMIRDIAPFMYAGVVIYLILGSVMLVGTVLFFAALI